MATSRPATTPALRAASDAVPTLSQGSAYDAFVLDAVQGQVRWFRLGAGEGFYEFHLSH